MGSGGLSIILMMDPELVHEGKKPRGRRVASEANEYPPSGMSSTLAKRQCTVHLMRIVEVLPREGYNLFLRFEDGASGVVDLSSFAGCGVFAAWLEPGVFEQVRLAEAGHPEWPGEIDLCADSLYMRLTGKHPEDVFPKLRHLPSHA